MADSANQGYSFIATVIAGGIIGYIIDAFLPTAPWGLLGMMVVAIIYATYKAQLAMNAPPSSEDEKKDDKKE